MNPKKIHYQELSISLITCLTLKYNYFAIFWSRFLISGLTLKGNSHHVIKIHTHFKFKMSLFTADYWYDQLSIKNTFNIFSPAKYTTSFFFSLFTSLLSYIISNKPYIILKTNLHTLLLNITSLRSKCG